MWPFLRLYPVWLSCLSLLFLSSIALKLSSFLDFINILSAVDWKCPTHQAFYYYYYYYLWRVEVKLTGLILEVFCEPGHFSVFILCGSLACLF